MKKIFVLMLIALSMVCMIDILFKETFKKSPWGIYKKLHQILEDTCYYDIWIMGSSRAETAFETCILSQKTKFKFFNAGIQGAKTPQIFYLLKHILRQHPTPQYLILDIDVHNLENKDTFVHIEHFSPFLYIPDLRINFSHIDPRVLYAYYFPLYDFSFYGLPGWSKFIHTITYTPSRYDTSFQISGCYHAHLPYQHPQRPDTTHSFQFHPDNLTYLDSITVLCQRKNIPLLVTVSPVFQPDSNIHKAVQDVFSYLQKKNVKGIDFTDIKTISYDSKKFSDKYHLSFKGSVEFTKIFQDSLFQSLSRHDYFN